MTLASGPQTDCNYNKFAVTWFRCTTRQYDINICAAAQRAKHQERYDSRHCRRPLPHVDQVFVPPQSDAGEQQEQQREEHTWLSIQPFTHSFH